MLLMIVNKRVRNRSHKQNSRIVMKNLKKLAAKYGGRCLSKVYVNARTKLNWRCPAGHSWRATSHAINQGRWCAACAGKKRTNISDLKRLASDRGGVCLAMKVVRNSELLQWKCEAGHRWKARPYNVKRGSWCPVCSRESSKRIQKWKWSNK